jgi:hypothetical protein
VRQCVGVLLQRVIAVQQDLISAQQELVVTRIGYEPKLKRVKATRFVCIADLRRFQSVQQRSIPFYARLPYNLQREQTSQTRFIAAQQRA